MMEVLCEMEKLNVVTLIGSSACHMFLHHFGKKCEVLCQCRRAHPIPEELFVAQAAQS